MDRWRIAENQPRVFRDETTDKHYVASNHFQADRIVTVLDAYEARIAELEADLARVKSESLRVVKCGEACAVDRIPTGLRVALHGRQGVFRRVGSGSAANPVRSFLLFEDCNSGNEIEVEYGALGWPVRLMYSENEG